MSSVLMACPSSTEGRDFPGFDGLVPRAALGVEKPEQFLEGVSVCSVANEGFFPLGRDECVVLQLLEMMGERRAANTGLG